jgi:hypothetical protein
MTEPLINYVARNELVTYFYEMLKRYTMCENNYNKIFLRVNNKYNKISQIADLKAVSNEYKYVCYMLALYFGYKFPNLLAFIKFLNMLNREYYCYFTNEIYDKTGEAFLSPLGVEKLNYDFSTRYNQYFYSLHDYEKDNTNTFYFSDVTSYQALSDLLTEYFKVVPGSTDSYYGGRLNYGMIYYFGLILHHNEGDLKKNKNDNVYSNVSTLPFNMPFESFLNRNRTKVKFDNINYNFDDYKSDYNEIYFDEPLSDEELAKKYKKLKHECKLFKMKINFA